MKSNAMQVLQDIKTNRNLTGQQCFNRMSDATALGRPGPMAEIPNYVAAILDKSKIKITNTPLDEITTPTNGIIVYQEQVMAAVKALAGFTAGQADTVRKVMGKKLIDKLAELREWFIYGNAEKGIPGCITNGYSEEFAKDLWDRMAEFGKYAFNKSHAVAYTYLSAKTAWLSYYYPSIFMKATLNSFIDNNDKIKFYIAVCKEKGIEVLSPDVNKSQEQFAVDYSAGDDIKKAPIRFGLKGIKSLGAKSKLVIAEREANGEFTSYQDFVKRMIGIPKFDKSAVEALIMAGALDSFEGTRKNKLEVLETLEKRYKSEAVLTRNGQMTLFELAKELEDEELIEQIEEINSADVLYTDNIEYDNFYKLDKEKEYTGFYITSHPINEYKELFAREGACDIIELTDIKTEEATEVVTEEDSEESGEVLPEASEVVTPEVNSLIGEEVTVAGIVKDVEVRYTKKDSSKMKTFVIEDDTDSIKCVIFPKKLAEAKNDSLTEDKELIMVTGTLVSDESFGLQILVNTVRGIKALTAKPVRLKANASRDRRIASEQAKDLANVQRVTEGGIPFYLNYNGNVKMMRIDDSQSNLDLITNIFGENNITVE